MCNLADKKYRVASIMYAASAFTLSDIIEKIQNLGVDQGYDAAYTVLGEMLEKGFIEVSQQTILIFNQETLAFDDKLTQTYRIISGKLDELKQYIEELDSQRLQPDSQGKPQGLNYRVLEQLIKEVTAHPEKLRKEETTIEQYVALAQRDEASQLQRNPRQRAVSEAYLRMLYAEYLKVKHLNFGEINGKQYWKEATIQYFKASELFDIQGVSDQRRIADACAYEILMNEYDRARRGAQGQLGENLWKFKQALDSIMYSLIRSKDKLHMFLSLVDYTIKEIEEETKPKPIKRVPFDEAMLRYALQRNSVIGAYSSEDFVKYPVFAPDIWR